MNRRAFLGRLGLAAGAVALSPFLDLAPIAEAPSAMLTAPTTGAIGMINTATYTFWRNQQVADGWALEPAHQEAMLVAMTQVYHDMT